MSDSKTTAEALRGVRKAIESTIRDYRSMPFFVRPMVKRGFTRRTGRSLDDWLEHIARAIVAIERGDDVPHLGPELARLADNYRTAPERAKRGMRGQALETMKRRSLERAETVEAAIEALGAQSS
ncbi:MAG: hypothetical protein KJO07_07350 [Deltaproteobacteria bacterium]|nr:hypothetical protein [Deltaproteobacteria bacterium]